MNLRALRTSIGTARLCLYLKLHQHAAASAHARLCTVSLYPCVSVPQVCTPALEEGMPSAVIEAWLLVDEFVLCEAQRSLLKLLRDVGELHLQRQSLQALSTPTAAGAAAGQPDEKLPEQVSLSSAVNSRLMQLLLTGRGCR